MSPGFHEVEMRLAEARLPGGWIVQASPFAILLAAAVWLHLHWEEIPTKFPVHWGLDGRPNGWATRSPAGVYAPLAMGFAVCGGLLLLNYGIAAFSRRIHARGRAGAQELRLRRAMLWFLTGVEFLIALLFSWVGFLALRRSQESPGFTAILVGVAAVVAAAIFINVYVGRGGTRPAQSSSDGLPSAPEPSPTEDRYWKAGMFYVNGEDPAFIVEKRSGIGYTLNFGHPLAWVVLALLVGLPLAVAFLVPHLK